MVPLRAVSADPAHRFSRLPLETWLSTAVFVWLAGVVALSVRLLGGWIFVQRLRRCGTRQPSDEWRARVSLMARRLRVTRPVQLLESVIIEVPTVIGCLRPVILLPASALSGLSLAQIEAVIAHALAHVRRYDYLVNGLQTIVETLLFYHPAVWWVSHRIRTEREHCCDDLAVAFCADRIAYARALADLEALRTPRAAFFVAATGGTLVGRIRRILGMPATPERTSPAWLVVCGVAAVLALPLAKGTMSSASTAQPRRVELRAVSSSPSLPSLAAASRGSHLPAFPSPKGLGYRSLPALRAPSQLPATRAQPAPPAPPTQPAPPPAPAPPAAPLSDTGDGGRFSRSDRGTRIDVRHRGTIELSDDDHDVVRISPDGYLTISEPGWFGSRRRIELDARPDGTIARTFLSGGRERPYDPDGRAWLADMLPRLVRRSRFTADARVARTLRAKGVTGVLAEISLIESDHVRAIYFTRLLEQAKPSGASLAQALAQAGREIRSDHELARLLMRTADEAMADEPARLAYVEAARSIESDYERRRALSAVVDIEDLSTETLTALLRAAAGIGSDYELASLLVHVADQHRLEGALRDAYLDITDRIASSHEQGRAVGALIKNERERN